MLFISPPFGNYLNIPNTTSITGSYTLNPRNGLIQQIFRTFRYSHYYGGWINKIGLRNKGIDYAIRNWKKGIITSVAILDKKEIPILEEKIPKSMDIELNVSCPNVSHLETDNLSIFLNDQREWCIIKLSPLANIDLIDNYYNSGFRQFHCSNTLPIKEGGLSGINLIPYTSNLITMIKTKYPDATVIAGGGIRDIETIKKYKILGADHFSISTLCLSPLRFVLLLKEIQTINKI